MVAIIITLNWGQEFNPSLIPRHCHLVCAYNNYYDYAMLLLIDVYYIHTQHHHSIINSTCAGNEARENPDFYVGLIQLSFRTRAKVFSIFLLMQ